MFKMFTNIPTVFYSISATSLVSLQRQAVLMTDEGSDYPTVAAYFGWNRVLDRHHFTKQISSNWQNLDNPSQFRQDIIDILDECTVKRYTKLMAAARTKYTTRNAKDFFKKIKLYDNKLVHAFTSDNFTAGHISNQRSEGIMSAIKANGVFEKKPPQCLI